MPRKPKPMPTLYSAISDDGAIVRFSLHPILDGNAMGNGGRFSHRVVWGWAYRGAPYTEDIGRSCRSPGVRQGWACGFTWGQAIKWLMEGEVSE